MKRFAVIDLGTNTFHLLIAGRKSSTEFIEIYRERIYVRIGKEGMYRFSRPAVKRAMDAMAKFRKIIDLFEAVEVRGFATEAFRQAQNADVLIKRIFRTHQIPVDIISGSEEARLIFEGVRFVGALQRNDNLIMDIGGGSVELIIGSNKTIKWSVSIPIGVSVLKNKFHHSEPISKIELCDLRMFIKKRIKVLADEMNRYTFNTLIGCSGTFDVLGDALPLAEQINSCKILRKRDFNQFLKKIEGLNLEERKSFETIPENRADLIVVALVLLDEVLQLSPNFEFILVSPYALKEGLIAEMIRSYSV